MYRNALGVELRLSAASNNWPTANGASVRDGSQVNDVFFSAGAETLRGFKGDDTYQLYNSAAVVQENASEGIDTVVVNYWGVATLASNVENLILNSGGAVGGTGNALDNIIRAGSV